MTGRKRTPNAWSKQLRFDPVPPLLESGNAAVRLFTRRDLLGEAVEPIEELWELHEVARLVRRQLPNGAWKYPSPRTDLRSAENYNLLETYRSLGELVEKHELHKGHPAIRHASRYILGHQSVDGDIRGIYGNQYSPNYTAGFLELLTKAGLDSDAHVQRGFRWLQSIRQDDGGWAIPLRTAGRNFRPATLRARTIHPISRKPSSHLVTGVVLRALAAHPHHRNAPAARAAGALLASRLFKPDAYPDRRTTTFWTHFAYPFWFTDLLSALDSLSLLGFSGNEPSIHRALTWFVRHQDRTGLWMLHMTHGGRQPDRYAWLTLAVCRVFTRFFT
jgi:hypothetical protein